MITATQKFRGQVALVAEQGTNWDLDIELYDDEENTIPTDLSGMHARGQYRRRYGADSPVLIELPCSIAGNVISISVPPATSSACTTLSGVYDVEIFNSDESIVERVISGKMTIKPEVTI